MHNSFVLTIDTDWAPDCAIEAVADALLKKGIKATWFITHDSPYIRKLFKHDELFEFGLHPNFLPESTQGKDEDEVMDFLRGILPDSRILRTHALYQSSRLLASLVKNFDIEIDVSLFLPRASGITPHMLYFNGCKKGLLRIPYFWEDDVEMCDPGKSWDFSDRKYHLPGLKIFDFHPMYIYLNSDNMKNYEELKKKGFLSSLEEKNIEPFVNSKKGGTRNLFDSFTDYIAKEQKISYKIFDIAQAWNNNRTPKIK